MPTFDVVSELDMQEVRNAVDQASREISTRYDFKNTGSSVELKDKEIELATESEARRSWSNARSRSRPSATARSKRPPRERCARPSA
jgi:hypothetical protein